MSKDMRGLTQFITQLRAAETHEDEHAKVLKELANIRAKFASSSNSLTDYDKRKYIWKLVYIYLLGHPVDIGHMVAIGMIGSKVTAVKAVGYIACSVLFTERNELLRLVIQSIKQDLFSRNDIHQAMALSFIGVIGNREFAESLSQDLQKLLFSPSTRPIIRKKAVLALLRLFRKNPDVIPQEPEFDQKAIGLLEDGNIGVLTSVCSLLLALASSKTKGIEPAVPRAIVILHKVVFADPRNRSVYKYYNTICPWLQVKVLKFLQYFPAICGNLSTEFWKATPDQATHTQRLFHTLTEVINRTVLTKNVNKNNGDHSILFEVSNLVIHMARTAQNSAIYQTILEKETQANLANPGSSTVVSSHDALQNMVMLISTQMIKFITNPQPNYRYLGLDCMVKLSFLNKSVPILREQLPAVLTVLKDEDVTLRKRGLDVLYAICDHSNVIEIVKEMMNVLYSETNQAIKQDVILKVLVIAEKYHPNLEWYVDTTFEIICNTQVNNSTELELNHEQQGSAIAGRSFLTTNNDIWYRVIQMITNNESLQQYAVLKAYAFISAQNNMSIILPLNGVKLLVYILGEFSCKAFDDANNTSLIDPYVLFKAIQAQFVLCQDAYTKTIILTAYLKLAFTLIEMKPAIEQVFLQCSTSMYEELQQRAIEYHRLLYSGDEIDLSTLEVILDVMPQYETKTELESRLVQSKKTAADRDIWTQPEPDIVTEITYGEDELMGPSPTARAGSAANELQQPSEGVGYAEQPQQMLLTLRQPNIELFNSDLLNVTVKLNAEGASAKMILVVTNKAPYDITDVSLVLPSNQDVIRAQCKPTSLETIPAGGHERFLLLWQCFRPFETPPPIKLVFTYQDQQLYQEFIRQHPESEFAQQVQAAPAPKADEFDLLGIFSNPSPSPQQSPPQQNAQQLQHIAAIEHSSYHISTPLRLPIFCTTFVTPNNSITGPTFLPKWKELGNQTVAKLQSSSNQYTTIPALTHLINQHLHFNIVPDCDNDPNNLYLYGTFNAISKTPGQANIQVDVMVRVETKPNLPLLRVTINSGSTSLSAAVMKSLQLMLLAKVVE